MKQKATIVYIKGDIARARLQAHTRCKDCGSCENKGQFYEAINGIGARSGDVVMIEIPGFAIISSSMLIFLFPVLSILLGYYLGGMIFSLAFLLFSFIIIWQVGKLLAKYDFYRYRVTKVLKRSKKNGQEA